jgi:hypothetical protein
MSVISACHTGKHIDSSATLLAFFALAIRPSPLDRLCTESFANSPAYFSGFFRSLKYQGVRGTHSGAKMNSRKRSYTTARS